MNPTTLLILFWFGYIPLHTIAHSQPIADSLSNWSLRTQLPLVIAETASPELEGEMLQTQTYGGWLYRDSTITARSDEPVLADPDAEATARSFVHKFYPSYSKSLELVSIEHSKSGWPRKVGPDSTLIVSFRHRWNGMTVYGSGVSVDLLGSKVKEARFYLWTVSSIVPGSERGIVSRDSATLIWTNSIEKYYDRKIQPRYSELHYYFFPKDNLPDFNPDRYILRPHWVFDESGLVIDAFDGIFWRND